MAAPIESIKEGRLVAAKVPGVANGPFWDNTWNGKLVPVGVLAEVGSPTAVGGDAPGVVERGVVDAHAAVAVRRAMLAASRAATAS